MSARRTSATPAVTAAPRGTANAGSGSWRWRVVGVAVIIAIVTVAYGPALRGGFILDDKLLLAENPLVQAPNGLYWFWFSTKPTDYWPVTNTSFWLEWRLWELDPTGYHVTNLLLHIGAVCLIWAILTKLGIPGAYLAALLFAVHPVNVESVSWISQRKNTLAMVFFLLSILWYLRDEEGRGARDEKRGLGAWYCSSLLAFVVAMLSKGSVAVLPVVLLLIAWWQRRRIVGWDVVRTVPFFAVAVVLTAVNVWFQKHGYDVVVRDADIAERLSGAGAVIWFYLAKALAPIQLVFVYPQWKIESRAMLWWLPLAATFLFTVILAWRIGSSWRRSLLFAWLFFCVALVPVLGFADVGFMQYALVADHYEHIAIIGVVALAAAAWSAWRRRAHRTTRWATSAAAIALVGLLTFLTWEQNKLYSGPLPLYEATLRQNPKSWPIHNDVGVALRKAGRAQEALAHYNEALRLNPNYADAHYNIGNLLLDVGQIQRALEEYEQSLRLKPKNASTLDNLGSALARLGRPQEAIEVFEQSLLINPDSPITHNNLGNALANLGDSKQAIVHYQEALRLKPNYAEAHNNLGLAVLDTDRAEALRQIQLAVRFNPNYADAHNNLAGLLLNDGQVNEALDHFRQALQLKPSYTEAYLNLAKAYAIAHQRAAAIATAEKGLELARSQGREPLAETMDAWLTEYRSHSDQPPQSALESEKVQSSAPRP